MRARFSEFILDSATRQLARAQESIHISPKAFELLQTLIEVSPRAVAKKEILELVWPGTFVSESTVAAVIGELRAALGDDAHEPRFVRTIHGFGYAFCAEVERLPESGEGAGKSNYRLIWGGREISLAPGENVLGRGRESLAWIDDPSISRRHAAIRISGDTVTVEDLGSKNGTFLQGKRIEGSHTLADGDQVLFGRVSMTFRVFRDGVPTASVSTT